jgi:hypothetical protein
VFSPGRDFPKRYALARTDRNGKRQIVAIDDEDSAGMHGYAVSGDDYFRKRRLISQAGPADSNKICAHATNSLLKWLDASRIFRCLELEIHVDPATGEVFVFGPPTRAGQLTLAELLKFGWGRADRLWLSLRDSKASNLDLVLRYLDRVIPAERRSRVLLETSAGGEIERSAHGIRRSGYRLSYRLPAEPGLRCSRAADEAGCAEMKAKIAALFRKVPYSGVSFDEGVRAFVSAIALPEGIELYPRDLKVRSLKDVNDGALKTSGMYLVSFESRFNY